MTSVLSLQHAALAVGGRVLWRDVDLEVAPGEFVAVLGANGSGKTSLLRTVLGEHELSAGRALLQGDPVRRGDRRIGYVPQQRLADAGIPLRARDLVGLGLDGHRWGTGLPRRERRRQVDGVLAQVGATKYAEAPVGLLSGGEQQRLRIGQALVGDPALLLCDEPLLSLDLRHQYEVSELIDRQRRERDIGVLFVTHDVNPVLDAVDRVLYLANGHAKVGTPDEVLRSDVLSGLYGSPVEVLRTGGRVVVAGAIEDPHHHDEPHQSAPDAPHLHDERGPADTRHRPGEVDEHDAGVPRPSDRGRDGGARP